MSKLDCVIVGGGPAGLMAAKTAAESGLSVVLVEKNKDYSKLRRACSAQFILDDGYQSEFIKLENGMIHFTKNQFSVPYTGKLVPVKNKYYSSPKGHRIHFALPKEEPFAYKFDKRKLLDDLYQSCIAAGIDIRLNTLALSATDTADGVTLTVRENQSTYTIEAKKLILAEGCNAHLADLLGLNKNRMMFAVALTRKYIMKGLKGIEPNSWNLYYGTAYHSGAAIIIGPSLYDDGDVYEVTISGSHTNKPQDILNNAMANSPLTETLKDATLIEQSACSVKAYSSLQTPYQGNVLAIGDTAAFVEVEVQGALMCGFHAAHAVKKELDQESGFADYADWWKRSFEFNREEHLRVAQGYALVPTYTDDELDYLFGLIEHLTLTGTYSQYLTPKLIWDSILQYRDKIKSERPEIYAKIEKMNTMTLTDTFK